MSNYVISNRGNFCSQFWRRFRDISFSVAWSFSLLHPVVVISTLHQEDYTNTHVYNVSRSISAFLSVSTTLFQKTWPNAICFVFLKPPDQFDFVFTGSVHSSTSVANRVTNSVRRKYWTSLPFPSAFPPSLLPLSFPAPFFASHPPTHP